MSHSELKTLINKLVRTADFPMYENQGAGAGNEAERARVSWKRFNAGSQSNLVQGGPLPPEIASRLDGKMDEFRQEFEQFAQNDKTNQVLSKYSGLIFAYYAADFTGNDYPSKMKRMPEYLQQTLEFVRSNNIQLPTLGQGGDKGIGTAHFMSHNGHAWGEYAQQRQLGGISQGRGSQNREVMMVTNPAIAERNGWSYGSFAVSDGAAGAGLFIDTTGTTGEGLQPILSLQTGADARKKFFQQGLDPKGSTIVLPQGPNGETAEPAKKSQIGRYVEFNGREVAQDAAGNPMWKPGLTPAQQQKAEDAWARHQQNMEAMENGTLYQMRLQEDGSIMVRNIQTNDTHPMTSSQLQSLLKPGYLRPGVTLALKPAETAEGQTEETGRFGTFRSSDELMADLSAEDGQGYFRMQNAIGPGRGANRNPYSFESLRELQHYLGGGRVSLNAYRLAVIGPQFSTATNLGEGQGVAANPFMMSPEHAVDPAVDSLAVDRGVQWGVYMTTAAPQKIDAQGIRGSTPWRKIAVTETIEEAFSALANEAAKADPDADLAAIGQDAQRIAQQALGKAQEMPADAQLPAQAPAPMQQPEVNMPNADTGIIQPGNNTMASLQRMRRKLSK